MGAGTYQRHIWIISLNNTDSLAGSDFILSFSISISCILDESSTQGVSVTSRAQVEGERTVNSVAALLKRIHLFGSEGVVVFQCFGFGEVASD